MCIAVTEFIWMLAVLIAPLTNQTQPRISLETQAILTILKAVLGCSMASHYQRGSCHGTGSNP